MWHFWKILIKISTFIYCFIVHRSRLTGGCSIYKLYISPRVIAIDLKKKSIKNYLKQVFEIFPQKQSFSSSFSVYIKFCKTWYADMHKQSAEFYKINLMNCKQNAFSKLFTIIVVAVVAVVTIIIIIYK